MSNQKQIKQELAKLLVEKEQRLRYNKLETCFPDEGLYKRSLYPKHVDFMNAGKKYKQRAIIAANRTGKAQPLDSTVMTPTGPCRMGDLQVGDMVTGSDGKPTQVVGVFPQGQRPTYRITFSDRTSVLADEEHLWSVRTIGNGRKASFKTVTTCQLLDDNYALPDRPVVEFEEIGELPLDPYLLGLLLGDGGLSAGNSIIISSIDSEIIDYCRNEAAKWECELKQLDDVSYRFSSQIKKSGRYINWLQMALNEFGLMGSTSYTKKIPEVYLISSADTRLSLLQGLMDTDGWVGTGGASEFSTVSAQLAKDFEFLARSLGISVTKTEIINSCGNPTYRIYVPRTELPIFRLTRKVERQIPPTSARAIKPVKVEFVGSKACQCIQVAASDSLYLTDHFIPTHNTFMGAYEMALHLTGLYPNWWKGRKFTTPIKAWAASKSNQVTKEVLQEELLGPLNDIGSGMIPRHCIEGKPTKKPGVPDAIEAVRVRHTSGGISELIFKSYDQGRETFQGTKKQVIWLDEEPSDFGIYSECLTRTAGAAGDEGIIYCTFTPLFGLSDVVLSFLPDGKLPPNGVDPRNPHKYIQKVTWDEVPHLSKEWQEETLASYAPHERDARSKGTPSLGAGAIYPYPEEDMVVEPFRIPVWWPKVYGLDVGWNCTAAIWGAIDPDSGRVFLYSEHYAGQSLPAVHASAIKGRGKWITGVIDPKSENRSQADGVSLLSLYEVEGLDLLPADNSVEAGIYKVNQLLAEGQLKVFNTLSNFLSEFRVYRRDEKGRVVKKNDHLMDAMRYLIMSGLPYARTQQDADREEDNYNSNDSDRSDITGY